MSILKDSFGRKFPYIRLSISDVCNFKCGYCLPNGYQVCLLYTSPSPRDYAASRMPSSA